MKYFDFICNECKAKFEKLIKQTDKVECPSCGSLNTQIIPNVGGFKFNGKGFEHRK